MPHWPALGLPLSIVGEPLLIVALDLLKRNWLAAGQKAHDIRVVVEGEQMVNVRFNEASQGKAFGLKTNLHAVLPVPMVNVYMVTFEGT